MVSLRWRNRAVKYGVGLLTATVVAGFVWEIAEYLCGAFNISLYWGLGGEPSWLSWALFELGLALPGALGWFVGAFVARWVFGVPGFPHSFVFVFVLLALVLAAGVLVSGPDTVELFAEVGVSARSIYSYAVMGAATFLLTHPSFALMGGWAAAAVRRRISGTAA